MTIHASLATVNRTVNKYSFQANTIVASCKSCARITLQAVEGGGRRTKGEGRREAGGERREEGKRKREKGKGSGRKEEAKKDGRWEEGEGRRERRCFRT